MLPLGNYALGLAILYGVLALGWLALSWRDPRWGLAFLAGPVLAAVGLLALFPLVTAGIASAARRAAQTLAAVAVAAVVAGLRGVAASLRPGDRAAARPRGRGQRRHGRTCPASTPCPAGLALEALALAAVAVALPYARTPWRLAGLGAAMLAATLLTAPAAPALPVVLAVWLTVGGLALKSEH